MIGNVDDQPAFILHRRDYRESSLLLELITADHGRVPALARGARKRRDVGSFQPGCRLSVGWRGRGELKTLAGIESRRIEIPADCQLPLLYVNELLIALLPRFEPQPGLFERYQHLLLSFAAGDLQAALRGFEMDLLATLGLMPSLDRQADGSALQPDFHYRLQPQGGLQPCMDNHRGALTGKRWLAIAERDFGSEEPRSDALRVLRKIIDSNLGGRELQSRKLYLQMTRKD